MNEDKKTYNGHTYSGNLLSACLNGYEQGKADERANIKAEFKIYNRLEAKFTLNQCNEKDGVYHLDVTELFNGLVDQVINNEEQK